MSTKSKKLYSRADLEEARRSHEQVQGYYSRKHKRRRTVQMRVDAEWHQKIKRIAKEENMVMSVLLDKICKLFFKHYQ